MKKHTHTGRHLSKCRRGAVQVEYAFLLVFVMVPTAAALLVGGRQVYATYLSTRTALLSSSP
jgi:hypothetical protein